MLTSPRITHNQHCLKLGKLYHKLANQYFTATATGCVSLEATTATTTATTAASETVTTTAASTTTTTTSKTSKSKSRTITT